MIHGQKIVHDSDADTLFFKNIASGSKGNCTLIWDRTDLIVIDLGVTMKKFRDSIRSLGLEGREISLFISHEHSDHISGVPITSKYIDMDVYLRPALAGSFRRKTYEMDGSLVVGNFEVRAFEIPHDAADPIGFSVFWHDAKISVVSDLGKVTDRVIDGIRDSDILAFESNHDVEMLRTGSYPEILKRRILSDHGHLSNEQSAEAIAKVATEETRVILTHLSQENNRPEIALNEVRSYLENRKIRYRSIETADQYAGSSLYSLER
ncbi:MBL fold metallo-hydrolase [Thermoplasma sp.]|uniref:MBL fold metallo-hydrolase n=1 Tax=Thermoplasma sp. TaxID=1973142 RepID=UPI0025EBFA71|nr:MBL fold metallo-hydrolase [Thermoplasma sp.]